jgi:hypothetical protein
VLVPCGAAHSLLDALEPLSDWVKDGHAVPVPPEYCSPGSAAELTAATGVRHVHVVEGMIGW